MGSETEVRELLFFDTFSHDNTEELNLDLIQFPRPVLIHEVRVVPLGTRVTADFPGGVRLGATTPSSFKLELFVNNLRKRNAVTFEKLGVLNYEQNVDIQLNSDARIPTDGLIVKGWYTTVTIAVYGCVTSLSEKDRSSPPPPPPTHSRSKPQAILPNTPDDAAYTAQDASSTPSQTPSQDPWGAEGRSGSQPLYPTAAEDSYPGEHTGDSSTNSPMPDKGHRDERHSKDDWDRRSRHSRSRSKERHDYRDSREFRDREYWDSYRDRDYKDKERSWTPDRRSRSPGHDRCNWTPPPRSPSQDHEEDRRNDRPREDRTLVTVPMEDTEPGEIQEEMQATETMDIYEGIPEEIPNENKIYDNLSDGEIQDAEGDAYSEISSDENMLADIQERYADWSDVEMDDTWIGLANFNPEQCDLAPMDTFTDPGLTAYELTKQRLMLTKEADLVIPDEATQIINIVEQFKDVAHDEKWIEAMDRVPGLVVPGLVYIVNKMDKKDVLDKLVAWTFEGLNVEAAIGQPLTAYKLRHIKMGIQLAATLSSCDSLLTFTVLSKDVQHRLLDLYQSPNMSSSLKLHIIKALDKTTSFQDGLDWLLGKHHLQLQTGTGIMDEGEGPQIVRKTGYQRVLEVLLEKQVVRCAKALSAFVRKVHFYQSLSQLEDAVQLIVENTATTDETLKAICASDEERDLEPEHDHEPPPLESISADEVDTIIACLEEAAKVLVHAESLIAQPRRCLPNSVMFAVRQKPYDPYPGLYHMFSACHLLESIFVLLSSPATGGHMAIFTAVRNLLTEFLRMQTGLIYLSSKTDTVNGILRTLTQQMGYPAEDGAGEQPAQQLGLRMVYCLQTLQIIDQLRDYLSRDSKDLHADKAIVLSLLHNLYRMTSTVTGCEAVVHVVSLDENMACLLPFIELSGDEDKDQMLRRSINHNYAVLLILLVVRESPAVQYLQKYAAAILASCDTQNSSNKLADKISELHDWLQPLEKVPTFLLHEPAMVSHLVTQMVTLAEDVTSLPTGLVTILRVLRYLAIDPFPEKQGFLVEELKHKHILIEMYSLGCVATLTTIIQKVGDLCLRPWQQGIPQCGVQATVIMGLLKPSLELLKAIMSYLIECRGTEFKDLSILPCLFNLHTVLCSVSNTGTLSPAVQEVQNLITDILMTFTQPALEVKEFEEGLKQSLWSLMMKEVFQYSLTAPYTFLSGLVLISELLPLPLPIQTREALTNDEVESALNTRKFWGAHIFPITTDMQALIKTLSDTSCQPLQQLLRRVCWQLADLAPSTALSVTRCLLDVVTESMDASVDPHPKDETKKDRPAAEALPAAKEHVRASRQTSRILNLLAFLMNQPPIKSAFLHLTQPGVKSDDKYTDILGRFVALLNVVSDNTSHAHAQMSIVSIFQSLCDMMVSMVVGDSSLSFLEQLASSLPAKESLLQICIGLLNHINNREYKFCSILPSLRTLTLLMDHDYGFYYVKQALDAVPTAFFQLFTLINTTFSKDSSDCIATLSSAAECIQFLVTLPDLDPTADPDDPVRTMSISWQEVKQMLAWNSDMLNHPLDDLDKLLQDYAKEEEALKAVHESITAVCCIVKDDHPGSKSDLKEPVLSAAESLTAQFGMRAIYVLTENEDERLSSIYWLSTPMAEESDQEIEKVECDLDEMNHKYCPDYNLVAELQKGAIPSDALTTLKPRRRIRSRPTRDTINTSKMRGSNRGFIAPMRGRGFGRGMPTGRNDLFRSRPPNTSRPPSMHVDDFIKMESEGQAPSLPTGMNARRPMDKEQQQMQQQMQQQIQQQGGGAGRGGRGGFDRGGGNSRGGGFSNRGGRFLSPPNNYGRNRDTNAPGGGGSYTGASSLMGGGGAGRAFSATKGGHMLMPRMDQWSASNATDRTPQQQRNYGSRTFGSESEGRLSSTSRVDRHQMLNSGGGRFSQHSSSSNKGRGSSSSRMTDWQAQQQQQGGRKDDRFGGQQRQSFRGGGSNRGFRDNRGRHQRSFTK